MKPHTIAISYDIGDEMFDLDSINDDGTRSFICAHRHFLNAQNHACMLLSETGDFRISINPSPGAEND